MFSHLQNNKKYYIFYTMNCFSFDEFDNKFHI